MSRRRGEPLVTRKHLARAERERVQRRWIIIGTVVTTLAVVGLLGYGWLRQEVIEPRQAVAVVNGESITTREFQARVHLARLDLIAQHQNLEQMSVLFGSDASLQEYFQEQLTSIEADLQNYAELGQSVLSDMINELLIRQEAERRGLAVAPAEVDRAIQEAFGYYAEGTPTPLPTATRSPATQTAVAASPTATEQGPEATTRPSPTLTPSATPGPSPTASSTPTSSPTPTPYTREAFEANYQAQIDYVSESGGSTEDAYRARYEASLYWERLQLAFEADVPHEAEQVWARHILVADEPTAEEVLALLHAGDPWEELAAEYSTDSTAQAGGDLGWFLRGEMYSQFEEAAFSGDANEVIGPVETPAGWHIIQILGHETRPLDETQYQQAVQAYFDNWLTEQRNQASIVIEEWWIDRVPVTPGLESL